MSDNKRFFTLISVFLLAASMAFGFGRAVPVSADNDGPNGICRLDKGGTFAPSETTTGYSVEVRGDGIQHWDLYRQGHPAVSFVVPTGEPITVDNMLGGFWEGNDPDCTPDNFDYAKDAQGYAKGRLDNGHSGLVVDLMTDTVYLVDRDSTKREWKVSGDGDDLTFTLKGKAVTLSTLMADFALLLEGHTLKWDGGDAFMSGTSGSSSNLTDENCANLEGDPDSQDPTLGKAWTVEAGDGYVVINLWSNAHDPNLGDYKMFLKPGEKVELMSGGGSTYTWGAGCGGTAQENYNSNNNPPITLAQYNAYVDDDTMPPAA